MTLSDALVRLWDQLMHCSASSDITNDATTSMLYSFIMMIPHNAAINLGLFYATRCFNNQLLCVSCSVIHSRRCDNSVAGCL